MTHDEALAWAERWIDDWNRRDVEAVLADFADDIEFCSPLVVTRHRRAEGIVRGATRCATTGRLRSPSVPISTSTSTT